MAQLYTQKELSKLLGTLPEDLRDALLSEETAERIEGICKRYGVGEKTPKIAEYTGQILIGLLPPEELPKALMEELAIEGERAEKISREINRFILFPVKDSLQEFYKEVQFAPGGRLKILPEEASLPKELTQTKKPPAKPKKGLMADLYREPIEEDEEE
jgi:hypothetical protein